jgi:pyrroline-5-carboxylate reductase
MEKTAERRAGIEGQRIGVIGGGHMGAAFARCWLEKKIIARANLAIYETGADRREALRQELGCTVTGPEAGLGGCGTVILAVKPQDAESSCEYYGRSLEPGALVISVMAGVPLAKLAKWIGTPCRLVRCMPNLPAQIGMGVTAYVGGSGMKDRAEVEELLSAVGLCLRFDSEEMLHAATAVSGSGPGYVFYFVEHLMQAAQGLGLSELDAQRMIAGTFQGAIELWRSGNLSAADLRRSVASQGGTTEAAFRAFDDGRVGERIAEGVRRACERSRELAGK